MDRKRLGNVFRFLYFCVLKSCYNMCPLRREYLSLEVNGLTNSPKILHITQGDFFNLNCFHRDH